MKRTFFQFRLSPPIWRKGCALLLAAIFCAQIHAAVDFVQEIEPILIKRCSECHGPDAQKAKLRLDSRSSSLLPAKSGKLALVPGKAEESEILNRVTASDPDEVMPPKGARLTEAEISALRLGSRSFVATQDAAFAIDGPRDKVVLRALRRLSALDYEEVEDLLATVGQVADHFDDRLISEYGT